MTQTSAPILSPAMNCPDSDSQSSVKVRVSRPRCRTLETAPAHPSFARLFQWTVANAIRLLVNFSLWIAKSLLDANAVTTAMTFFPDAPTAGNSVSVCIHGFQQSVYLLIVAACVAAIRILGLTRTFHDNSPNKLSGEYNSNRPPTHSSGSWHQGRRLHLISLSRLRGLEEDPLKSRSRMGRTAGTVLKVVTVLLILLLLRQVSSTPWE
ncbi:hypothetical protein C8Q80DRAFT_1270405 [Daedaleopsis nitida]|nr:hypothetical protein C8Q80DRAFT_1270405 [Daedaleopsis nitida]